AFSPELPTPIPLSQSPALETRPADAHSNARFSARLQHFVPEYRFPAANSPEIAVARGFGLPKPQRLPSSGPNAEETHSLLPDVANPYLPVAFAVANPPAPFPKSFRESLSRVRGRLFSRSRRTQIGSRDLY